jgi:hypothetical protein
MKRNEIRKTDNSALECTFPLMICAVWAPVEQRAYGALLGTKIRSQKRNCEGFQAQLSSFCRELKPKVVVKAKTDINRLLLFHYI